MLRSRLRSILNIVECSPWVITVIISFIVVLYETTYMSCRPHVLGFSKHMAYDMEYFRRNYKPDVYEFIVKYAIDSEIKENLDIRSSCALVY